MASATVASSAIVLEVLNQHNYNDWRSRVKTYLLAEDLWDVVESAKTGPESKERKDEMSDKAWGTKDAKALHAIKISCGTEIFSFIQKVRTAKEAWKVLESKFKSSDIVHLPKKGDEMNPNHKPFFDYVEKGDWDNAQKLLNRYPKGKIPKTALHTAVMHRRVNIVRELVNMMSPEELRIKDGEGRTALCCTIVASDDDGEDLIEMASCMVQKDKEILKISFPARKHIPVVLACAWSKLAMTRYLFSVTTPSLLLEEKREQGAQLICTCIRHMTGLDIAWRLLQKDPRLAVACNKYNEHPMLILARARNAFLSGEQLTFWQKLIYRS